MRKRDTDAVVEEYERLAPHYDRRWASYVEATARESLGRLEPESGERLLDVGCGTGVFLAAVSRWVGGTTLAGVDPSPAMLRAARDRLGGSARLVQSYAERLPFSDAAFDAVVSNSAFHFFRDPRGALSEMVRVLRPGGRLVLTDWCGDFPTVRALDLWLRLSGPAHVRVYGVKVCCRLLDGAGFEDIRIDRYKIDWFWGLMTAMARKSSGRVRRLRPEAQTEPNGPG